MTQVAEIMTRDVQVVGPEESLQRAAQLMQDLDVGALPVASGARLLGIVTDRDITIRGVAAGMTPSTACVSDVMSVDVQTCSANDDSHTLIATMGQRQLRRVPVLDAAGKLVGIVSLGDIALRQSAHIDGVVREISEPGGTSGRTAA